MISSIGLCRDTAYQANHVIRPLRSVAFLIAVEEFQATDVPSIPRFGNGVKPLLASVSYFLTPMPFTAIVATRRIILAAVLRRGCRVNVPTTGLARSNG